MSDMPNNLVALLGTDDYVGVEPNASVVNGKLRYIILDVDKPQKIFYDLQNIFNATVGEKQKILPIQFQRSGEPIPLNNIQVSMDGAYPSGLSFHVVGSVMETNSPIVQFVMLDGMFQEVGDYVFTFSIQNTATGALETSHNCFFSVGQNINSLAIDWNNGVNPYDSEYAEWKAQTEAQINQMQSSLNNFSDQVTNFQNLITDYTKTVNDAVNTAWNNKLSSNNTFTGSNAFNGGLTASSIDSTGNINGANVNGTDLKLNNKSLKWAKSGDCTLEGLASNDDGTHVSYWVNANTLYITGWVDKPKTAYKTFKAYIPTSITSRLINTRPYYVAVNDYDWTNPSTATNPTEFVLYGSSGVLQVNGSGNDGGSRLDWVLPLKDA